MQVHIYEKKKHVCRGVVFVYTVDEQFGAPFGLRNERISYVYKRFMESIFLMN